MEPTEQTRPPIDRALIGLDLDRLATILAPLVEGRLPSGASLVARLMGSSSVSDLMSRSFRQVLGLDDDELGELIDAAGVELGAWRGVRRPLDDAYLSAHPAAAPAARRFVESVL